MIALFSIPESNSESLKVRYGIVNICASATISRDSGRAKFSHLTKVLQGELRVKIFLVTLELLLFMEEESSGLDASVAQN